MRTLSFVFAFTCTLALSRAADWPQYRGANRDDVSTETGLLKEWPKGGPPLAGTFEAAGVGYSPPAVVGDRVYLTGGREDKEFLIALDIKAPKAGAVKELWAAEIGPTFRWKGNSWSAGPSASPTVDGELIFALGGNGDLICVDKTGKEKWRANLPKDLEGQVNPIGGGPKNLGWGFTGSPLVDGEKLILAPGGPKGTLAALDKKTGRVIWRSTELTDQSAYTSPMLATIGEVKQYVILTNQGLAGVSAKDGKLLWSHRRKPAYGTEVVNTPLIRDGLIYTTVAAGNGGCEVVKVEKAGDKFKVTRVWGNKDLMNHHGNVVLVGGHVYGNAQGAGWVCQDFKTGEVVWSERKKLAAGAITFADGRLYCFAENDGTTALIEASADGWKETGRLKLPKSSKQRQPQGRIWTPPVVANGKLYLRDQEFLFCFDVKGK
ncbi:MAG: PQQ-like beta-propeller repeat protein [Planctomycetia bacterium]|nr:PQQ-like beta-propeller repeat protein [Planctomycetia bacterium]